MSLSKKYIYVHKCSTAQNTPDNFRKVLGRAWVPSETAGMQYGYDVQPPVMDMTFGPYMEWAHDYFYATEMPAATQIVSIKPNPLYFPDLAAANADNTVDPDQFDEAPPQTAEDPCCGWYAYLGAHFADHFSSGNPAQILRTVLETRVEDHKFSIGTGTNKALDNRHFPGDSCGASVEQTVVEEFESQEAGTDRGISYGDDQLPTGVLTSSQVRLFKDLWFQIMTPFSQIEDAHLEGQEKALVSDVRFNYNFYLDAYEQQLQGNALPEIRIPNLYLTVGQDDSIPYVLYLQNNVKCRFKDFEKLVLQKGYREYLIPSKTTALATRQKYIFYFFPDGRNSFFWYRP